jgi:hypothetical protein
MSEEQTLRKFKTLIGREWGFGGIQKRCFWKEYLRMFNEESRNKLELLKSHIEANNLYALNGMEYQKQYYDDWKKTFGLTFSFRGWGDFMASLMNTKEGSLEYEYTDFSW